MSVLFLTGAIVFSILFLVTLIEFLTGAERQGMKFFVFFFIFLAIISIIFSLKSSEIFVQQFANLFASLLNNLGIK